MHDDDDQQPVPPLPGPLAPAEPLWGVGGIIAVTTTALTVLVAFGLPLDDDRQAAILGFVAAGAPLITAWAGRGRVWSPNTVRQAILHERERRQ